MAKLKVYRELEDYVGYGDAPIEMYDKEEADTVIAELEETARQQRLSKVEYKDSANNLSEGLAEAYRDNRKLKRALWLARAMRAHAEQHWGAYIEYVHRHERSFYGYDGDDILRRDNRNNDSFREWHHKWASVEYKCKLKSEEYK